MRIFLFEFIDEAKSAIKEVGEEVLKNKNVTIICLHPSVRSFFQSRGITVYERYHYFPVQSMHQVCRLTEKFSQLIDKSFNYEDEFGISKGYRESCVFYVRGYLNYFFSILAVLDQVFLRHDVKEISCGLVDDRFGMNVDDLRLLDSERYLGLIARELCVQKGVKFSGLIIKPAKRSKVKMYLSDVVRYIGKKYAKWQYNTILRNRTPDQKSIFVPALSYRMDMILENISRTHRNAKFYMVWTGPSTLRQEIKKIYHLLKSGNNILSGVFTVEWLEGIAVDHADNFDPIDCAFDEMINAIKAELQNRNQFSGIDISPFLIPKIDQGLRLRIKQLKTMTRTIHQIFEDFDISLLMAMYSNDLYGLMGELSHVMNFESLNISHGTHVPPNNDIEQVENYRLATNVILNQYKEVAVQTPWADKFLTHYEDSRPRVYSGPLLYSSIDQQQRFLGRNKYLRNRFSKIVLHATTIKTRRGMRFHIVETEDEYVSSLIQLVNAVHQLKDVFLIIRPHPVCDISKEDLTSLLPEYDCFQIISEGPFSDLLSIADLVISYSSTCIEEAIVNNLPVILFDQWNRYNHFNLQVWSDDEKFSRQPAYYVNDAKDLPKSIRQVLDQFEYKPLSDDELGDYKYPQTSRQNFDQYVYEILKGSHESVPV